MYLFTLLFATPQAGIIPNWLEYKNIREFLSSQTELMKKLHESLEDFFFLNNICLNMKYLQKNLWWLFSSLSRSFYLLLMF